jgi:hypothetical protein
VERKIAEQVEAGASARSAVLKEVINPMGAQGNAAVIWYARRRRVRSMLWWVALLNMTGLLVCLCFAVVLYLFWRQMQVDDNDYSFAEWQVGLGVLFVPFAVFWMMAGIALDKLRRLLRILRALRSR